MLYASKKLKERILILCSLGISVPETLILLLSNPLWEDLVASSLFGTVASFLDSVFLE
jgi:hypothetical protein